MNQLKKNEYLRIACEGDKRVTIIVQTEYPSNEDSPCGGIEAMVNQFSTELSNRFLKWKDDSNTD